MLNSTRRATILTITLVLLVIASFVGVSLMKLVVDVTKVDERRSDGIKALFVAEGGAYKVIDYFNNPDNYPPDAGIPYVDADADGVDDNEDQYLFFRGVYDEDQDMIIEPYPNLKAAIEAGPLEISTDYYPVFTNSDGTYMGKCTSLKIEKTTVADPIQALAKITSVGNTLRRGDKTVILYVDPSDPIVQSPAAILTFATTYFKGNVRPRWGEVWSKAPTELTGYQNNKLALYIDKDDPYWTRVRTEQYFLRDQGGLHYYMNFLEGNYLGELTQMPTTEPYYLDPYSWFAVNEPANLYSIYADRFKQDENLNWPEYDYNIIKTLAMRRGHYYSTDASNKVYREGIEDEAHVVQDMETEFGSFALDDGYDLYFIDTIDGNPPALDGSNLATINLTGNSPHFQGLFFIANNVVFGGMGNPPNYDVERPDRVLVNLDKIWLDGLVIVSGDCNVSGNPVIYGSLIVKGLITGTGTPNVWYNHLLKDGNYFRFTGHVRVEHYLAL